MRPNTMRPRFGENYDIGYIGFTFAGDWMSKGVAFFSRWERMSDIRVAHALVVTGENECVEAHIETGVARAPLSKYFDDPICKIFFRKPRGWTPEMGKSIAAAAEGKLGAGYDVFNIVSRVLADNFVGHCLNKWMNGAPDRLVSRLMASRSKMICSELAAYALNQQPSLTRRGILATPLEMIEPQALFEDVILFEPWRDQINS